MDTISDAVERHQELHSLIWDMYKDVYGIRPRHMSFETMTVPQLEAEVKCLEAALEIEISNQRKEEQQAIVLFEAMITTTTKMGAGDRATAIRWIHEAQGTDGDDDYLCWQLGVPYGYLNKSGFRMLGQGSE